MKLARAFTMGMVATTLMVLWRGENTGVPTDGLDLLASSPVETLRLPRAFAVTSTDASPFLAEGWGRVEAWNGEPFRRIVGLKAELILPSAVARARHIRVRVAPLDDGGRAGPQSLTLSLNSAPLRASSLPRSRWSWVDADAPAGLWKLGRNVLTLEAAWAARPSDSRGRDRRLVSCAVTTIAVTDAWSEPTEPRGPPPRPRDGITLSADDGVALYACVPPRATISFRSSPLGSEGTLTLYAEVDGSPPRRLWKQAIESRAFFGDEIHSVSLSGLDGSIARLTFVASARDSGSLGRALCRIADVRLQTHRSPTEDPVEAFSAVAATAVTGRPDLLICLLDALRATDLSGYGQIRATSPHVDRLLREGTALETCYSAAPNTAPAVKALLTGRHLTQTGYGALSPLVPTLPETLRVAGYATAAFSGSPFVGATLGTDRGFEFLDESLYETESGSHGDHGARLAAALARWIPLAGSRAAFAYVHAILPHNPYAPPPPFSGLFSGAPRCGPYDGSTSTLLAIKNGRMPADSEGAGEYHHLLYLENVVYGDDTVAKIVALFGRGRRERRAVVAVVGDHGEEFLEHGGVLHGYTLYDEMIRIPTILAGPRVPRGSTYTGLTESVDLAPTLLDLAGTLAPNSMEGRSLVPLLWSLRPAAHDALSSASCVGGVYSLVSDRWKYIFAPRNARDGAKPGMGSHIGRTTEVDYLFDLASDPTESNNVAAQFPILTRHLNNRLRQRLDASRDDEAPPAPPWSPEDCDKLRALGYVQLSGCP